MSTSALPVSELAHELFVARANRAPVAVPPSAREGGLDLDRAYAIEAELVQLRLATGRQTVGRKVGFANKAMWRVLKLQTLVWAHMYDDTIQWAADGRAVWHTGQAIAPKIEPEIVFKLKKPVAGADPAEVLAGVEWLALGFEVIDCPFPDWQFQPVDFVAAFGLHAALIVGEPTPVTAETIPALAAQLAAFKVRLLRDDALVEEGGGRNSLRSPALCLGELARHAPLSPGDLVSSGTLTTSTPISAGQVWRAEAEGLGVQPLTLTLEN